LRRSSPSSLIVDPPDGRMPMTTAEAEKRRASRDRGTVGDGPSNTFEDAEQFKRVSDDVVQYQFTVDDPVTYAQPFTMSMPLTPLSGGVLLHYECHEGNLAVRNALSAERAEDRAVAEDLAKGIKRQRRGVQESGVGGGGNRGRGAGAAPAAGGRGGRGGDPADAN
jgi:hypothetical protein